MENVHEHGNFLHVGNAARECRLTSTRALTKRNTVLVACNAQIARGFQDIGCFYAGDAYQNMSVLQILQEQVVTEMRLVAVPQVAEALLRRHAAHANNKRGLAAGNIVRIGVFSVAENKIKPVQRINVSGMHAKDDARRHVHFEIRERIL